MRALKESIDTPVKREKFIKELYLARYEYINNIIKANPKLAVFKKGWINRMKDLEQYNKKFK